MQSHIHPSLRKVIQSRRLEIVGKQGLKFRLDNREHYDHKVLMLGHYFIRGIDPSLIRGVKEGESFRAGLDIVQAVPP
jgi:hypothetical protein